MQRKAKHDAYTLEVALHEDGDVDDAADDDYDDDDDDDDDDDGADGDDDLPFSANDLD